jgi:Methyltransferase domain/Glycosyl transferase family 8
MVQLFETRDDMIRTLVPKGGVYAEIGVLAGQFSRFLFSALEPRHLVLLDLFEGVCPSGDRDGNNMAYYDLNKSYANLVNWSEACPAVEVRKGDGVTHLETFPDESFDMIYVDGDHSYQGCKRDLEVALRKVRRGGWICGHDYEMNMSKAKTYYNFGVGRAVDEFCLANGLEIAAKGMDGCVSFAIQKGELTPKKNLVYYTIGRSRNYLPLLKMSIESLRMHTPQIDIVILCDESLIEECSKIIPDVTLLVMPDSKSPEDASMHKLQIFDYPDIWKYQAVIFIDSDILVCTDINQLLEGCVKDDVLYVGTEKESFDLHKSIYYSLCNYTDEELARFEKENIYAMNAGCFAFRPSAVMEMHFSNIIDMIDNHTGDFFYEQSFLNAYFNRLAKSVTDRSLLSSDVYKLFPAPTDEYEGRLLHFCGNPGEADGKLQRMWAMWDRILAVKASESI